MNSDLALSIDVSIRLFHLTISLPEEAEAFG